MNVLQRAFDYWWIIAIGVTVAWLVALTVYVQALDKPAGNVPIIGGDTYKVVASTGSESFDVEAFCNDRLTTVEPSAAPDVSGEIYVLQRVRDGVAESVLAIEGVRFATHYYSSPSGQQSQTGVVSDKAWSCIRSKR